VLLRLQKIAIKVQGWGEDAAAKNGSGEAAAASSPTV
jgi:hypothetical protein